MVNRRYNSVTQTVLFEEQIFKSDYNLVDQTFYYLNGINLNRIMDFTVLRKNMKIRSIYSSYPFL